MELIDYVIGWLLQSIGRLVERRSKGKLAARVVAALVLPVAAAAIAGSAGVLDGLPRPTVVLLMLLFGVFGLLLSVGELLIYARLREHRAGNANASATMLEEPVPSSDERPADEEASRYPLGLFGLRRGIGLDNQMKAVLLVVVLLVIFSCVILVYASVPGP